MRTETRPEIEQAVLLEERSGGVVRLTMNRPAQFNALSEALLVESQGALEAIAADESARVVVIAGVGKAFCAGHDLKEMRANPSKEYQQALFERCSRMMMTLTEM